MSEQAVAAADRLRLVLQSFDGLRLLNEDCVGSNGIAAFDRTKVTVSVADWGYTGVEVADCLRQAGVAVELTDAANVLFLVTYGDGGDDYDAVLAVIKQVFTKLGQNKKTPQTQAASPQLPAPQQALLLRQAFDSAKVSVPLQNAGRADLRRTGQLLSAGDTRTFTRRTGNGSDHRLLRKYEKLETARQRPCRRQLKGNTSGT